MAIYAGTNLIYGQELLSQELYPKTVVREAYSAEWRIDACPTLTLV